MYAQMPVPQMAQVPVQMAVPSAQVQMQNNSMTDQTAAMGHMKEVMMQMQDVTADDNATCTCQRFPEKEKYL